MGKKPERSIVTFDYTKFQEAVFSEISSQNQKGPSKKTIDERLGFAKGMKFAFETIVRLSKEYDESILNLDDPKINEAIAVLQKCSV